MKMDVDVYKTFNNLVKTKYLRDTYFVDSCLRFDSKFSFETNLNIAALRVYLENHNIINDCGEKRIYCELNPLGDKEIETFTYSDTIDVTKL